MTHEIYYVGFPGDQMLTIRDPVSFEVLKVTNDYLRIKLLESCPLVDGIEEEGLPSAGDEFRIKNHLRNGNSLIDHLRSGKVAGFYTSEGEKPEDFFAGTLFGYNPLP